MFFFLQEEPSFVVPFYPQIDSVTAGHGAPIADRETSLTVGPRGPILLQDVQLVEELAHFTRERIPERVVHAKGAGAFGYFEVTNDISQYSAAKVFSSMGKKTPIAIRFSTVGGKSGSADTVRDVRGFAVKFYTEDGIWDLVGNNTPIFFIRDPALFPHFIHTQKTNPQTNLRDTNMFWDFISLRQECTHQTMLLFADRGKDRVIEIEISTVNEFLDSYSAPVRLDKNREKMKKGEKKHLTLAVAELTGGQKRAFNGGRWEKRKNLKKNKLRPFYIHKILETSRYLSFSIEHLIQTQFLST
nr:unnamed protein product [Callosobruchus chinensis]